jgi:hypothetical protein
MTADDKALKARLMAEAEGAIDKLSAGRSDKEDLQLDDIERLVRAAGQTVMEHFTRACRGGRAEEGQRADRGLVSRL